MTADGHFAVSGSGDKTVRLWRVPDERVAPYLVSRVLATETALAAWTDFERALTQNLAFYWAHTRLAGSALQLHDTATALTELDMATQLEGRDPVLRLYRGVVLQTAGRLAEAELDLQKAVELDPYYADPYYFLATNRQALGDTVAAIGHYRQFLRRAARAHPYRPQTERQLRALAVRPDSS